MSPNAEAWAVLFAAFPKWDLSQSQQQVWDVLLSDLPHGAIIEAAVRIAREDRKFPPTPGEWRARALEQVQGVKLTAAEAWEEMYRNRHRRQVVSWSSEAVRRAAEAVRWNDPDWLTEQLPTIRAQFERYYTAIADKQERVDERCEVQRIVGGVSKMIGAGNLKALYGTDHPDDDE